MNKNVKHVVKEGGSAGKVLLINPESLVSTVQVLSAAVKATRVFSIASRILAGLFLALDVFFLGQRLVELHKGAKFGAKVKEVCKELQDGLIEVQKIKELEESIGSVKEEEEESEDSDADEEELDEEDEWNVQTQEDN